MIYFRHVFFILIDVNKDEIVETTQQQLPLPPLDMPSTVIIGGSLLISGAVAIAIMRGRKFKFGKMEIGESNQTLNRDIWELTIQTGFVSVIRDTNRALKDFLSRGVERFFVQAFISVLKSKGVPHHRIRYNTNVIRYEAIIGLSIRKIIIPRILLTFFQNHIPEKSDLDSSDSSVREKAMAWYTRKFNDVMEDSRDFITSKWPIEDFPHSDVVEYYLQGVYTEVLPIMIDMYEKVRIKRLGIIHDMQQEIKELTFPVVSKRWEEIFLLMGYVDILEG